MIKHKILMSLLMSVLVISCSKGGQSTSAKLKLNLSGITNLSSGIGAGGALLFGKSANGAQFGRLVSAAEQDIELPNGDWSFYAVMWENTTAGGNFKDTVYCGKSAQKLTGAPLSISMTLSNSICTNADFSNGTHYMESKNKFANFFIEECDELTKTNSFTCLRDNQGSALSYRMAFKSYNKGPAGVLNYTGEVMYSACKNSAAMRQGTGLNFPTSRQSMPFVISVEMFLGSSDCGVSNPETKGMFTHTFMNGIASDTSAINKMATSPVSTCDYGPANEASCLNYFGTWSGSVCMLPDATIAFFLPEAECGGSSSVFASKSLKQMLSIPKDYLCRNSSFSLTGADVFPGGNGTVYRPFKICSEWQLNQIGENYASSANLASKSYKLMNDLDMNNADFNVAARPSCVGVAGSLYKRHHNLNPIGQVTNGSCSSETTAIPYTGVFNGNNKTISHARINVNTSGIGFVRELGTNGVIKNLNFKNLQVEGNEYVGGIAGKINGSNANISNVKIFGGDIDTQGTHAGGIASLVTNTNKIIDVQVRDMKIHGGYKVGGLVAENNGTIERSMFRGRINQHTSSPTEVGGLVAEAGTGSFIKTSFSEGEIDSASKYAGGIAGTNAGSILNSYSNMYVSSRYVTTSAFIGGIAGSNTSGTITSVYFDGIVSGSGSPTVDNIVADLSTGTLATCSTSSSYIAVSYATCTLKDLRSGAVSEFIGDSAWKSNLFGTLPRLSWEFEKSTRACLSTDNLQSVSAQVAAGRGTFILPVIICNATQLKALSATPSNRYIKLADDINISTWTSSTDLIQTFSGILDGQGHAINGAVIDDSSVGNFGIFVNNTGTLSNLKIVGNALTHNSTGATGILAGVNSGVIRNVFMMNNTLSGNSNVGHVAGSNSVGGLVREVFIRNGILHGDSYVGGIAGSNDGTITLASVNTNMSDKGTSSFKFGGITGFNGTAGKVDQTVFSGNINPTYAVPNATPTYFGGLVGYNSGVVENSMTKNYSRMNVVNANSVGGLVGLNNTGATLRKSFSLGKLIYALGAVPGFSNFGPLSGYNAGTISNAMYLQNTTGGFIGQATSDTCSQTAIDFSSANPAYLVTSSPLADLLESVNYSSNGDALRNYIPFTVPITDSLIVYNNDSACTNGDIFAFYKRYDPAAVGKTITDFSLPATFSGFDLAMESSNLNVDRLFAYYKSEMYGTFPTLIPPIWELDENDDYPRLLQVRD